MRITIVAFPFVSVFVAAGLYAQSDPLAAIRDALTAKYKLTIATADKTAIVTDGSLLTLRKSDLLAAEASSAMVLSNNYKSGKITRGIMGQMARSASGTRTFVAGEKLWVTDIEVKPKGIVFWLLSDQYSGVRYRASLSFPWQKGESPSAADALAVVGEVFDGDSLPATAPAGLPTAAPPPTAGYPQPGVAPVQEAGDWDSRYGRITNDDLDRIKDPTVRFDLNYFRLNPAALDQKPVMRYFVALNNCNHRDVERALFNELDYPALAAFYKAKASQILAPLPRTITDVSFDRFIGGYQQGNLRLWSQSLALGEYDPQRKAFPLKYPGKDLVEIPNALSMDSGNRNLSQTCPAAQKAAIAVSLYLPNKYEITVPPAAYRELPMDEAAARQYIDSAAQQRAVFLAVDVAIRDSAPNVDRENNVIAKATFQAQVLRLRVIDSRTQKPLGALFDDGSLRADTQVAQAPPAPAAPAQKSGSGNWSFSDHMYDIRMSVYVFLAADACGWRLTDEQSANLKRFLDQVSTRGNFNERYQYNLANSRIKNAISAQGRIDYCANPSERRDFDKYAAMVAPLGPLAASGAK
jgi:hypothetical protein